MKFVKDYNVFDTVRIYSHVIGEFVYEGSFTGIPSNYAYREVVEIKFDGSVAEITINDDADTANKKFWFSVCTSSEGHSVGWVKMTMRDAMLLEKVSDKNNWFGLEDERYSGSFSIQINSACAEEEFEAENNVPEYIKRMWE